jgi:hypothetical protein
MESARYLLAVALCVAVLGSQNTSALQKKSHLWNEEDYKQVLKSTDGEEDFLAQQVKGIRSWETSGGADWSATSVASTYFSSYSIEWGSSYEDTNVGVNSEDLIGAQTGNLYLVESYVSTYEYSYKHTWFSTYRVTSPDGVVRSWTSHFTTYWTSTWTSSFTTASSESTLLSSWTSCTTGENTWVVTYTNTLWDSGSVATGEREYESSFSTTSLDSWESSWQSNWLSTITGDTVRNTWHSVSSRFYTSSD